MQPDFQSLSTARGAVTTNGVLRNTYRLLGLSMLPTAVGALIGVNSGISIFSAGPIVGSLLFLGIAYGLMFAIERNKYSATGVYLLLAFTFFMGFMLGPILQFSLNMRNGGELIGLAVGGTGLTFLGMSAFGSSTKRNLSGMTNFLVAGGIVLMIASLAGIFLHMPALQLVISAGFMLFSSLMIAFQVNQIVQGGETNYISATLTIYISIYNIFVSLLRILMAFGGSSRD